MKVKELLEVLKDAPLEADVEVSYYDKIDSLTYDYSILEIEVYETLNFISIYINNNPNKV